MGLLKTAARSEVSALRKQRVWLTLNYSPSRQVVPIWQRAAVATAVLCALLGITAAASAARGHWPDWAVRAYERLLPASVPAPSRSPRLTGRTEARGGCSQATPPARVDPTGIARAATDDSETNPHTAGSDGYGLPSGRGRRASARLPSVAARDVIGRADESRQVLAAMRALRRDRDPVRARALLRRYLREQPNGTLAEEALAVTIEAALVHRDPDANALGSLYLDRYPYGPFRALADQTRVQPSTSPSR
ncbi:MAG: hypothetical protein ABJA82_10620 [Myxococcales bacterium]